MKRAILFMAIFFLVVCYSNVSWANAVDPIVQVDRPYIMANEKRPVYVLVQFNVAKVKEDPAKPRPKLNLALVLDRSGSMADRGKLEYAKKAANIVVDSMKPSDRIAVIEYDDRISVLWPSSPAESPEMIKQTIMMLTPRGSTNLTGGMMKGVEETLKNTGKNHINRVILLSDGLANRGITNPVEIKRLVRESKSKGVHISTMGLGLSYNEDLMQAIAENAGGNYYFIESPMQMGGIFQQEMSILFASVTKDITMKFYPGDVVTKVDVFGYPFKQDEEGIKIEQEDFYSSETRSLLVRLEIEPQGKGLIDLGKFNLAYMDLIDKKQKEIEKSLSVQVTEDAVKVKKEENKKVLVESTLIEADQNHEEFVKMYERGNKDEAIRRIKSLEEELATQNKTLSDIQIAKKIEALKMESMEMKEAERNQQNRAMYLKKSKQRFYQSKKGKRGKYILKEGDTGYEVKRLQRDLHLQGFYKGHVDGNFTSEVTDAVKSFQRQNNLSDDGIAGPATLKALGNY